jgi:branched-chain amino acid transport system substrate-binding protein
VTIAAAAINKALSTDPAKIRTAMAQVGKGYAGVTGTISFDANGQRIDQPYEKVKFDKSVVER